MSAAALIAEAQAAGVRLYVVDGGRLRWTCTGPPPPDLLARIAAAKADVLALLAAEEGEAVRWRAAFEERAAIMELDGGLSRAAAEAAAMLDLAATWRAENPLAANDGRECAFCGGPGPCTPVLAHQGHAWLHKACWGPMNEARQQDALVAVRVLLGPAP